MSKKKLLVGDEAKKEEEQVNVELSKKPLKEFISSAIYSSEDKIPNNTIATVVSVRDFISNRWNKPIVAIRYKAIINGENVTWNSYYSRVYLIAIAKRLAGKIETINDLVNKNVKLERITIFVAGKDREKLIPSELI